MFYRRSRRHLGIFELCLIDEKASVYACKPDKREDLGCIRMRRGRYGTGSQRAVKKEPPLPAS